MDSKFCGLLRISEHMEAYRLYFGCNKFMPNFEILLEFFSEKNVIQIQKISVNFKRQKDDTTLVDQYQVKLVLITCHLTFYYYKIPSIL